MRKRERRRLRERKHLPVAESGHAPVGVAPKAIGSKFHAKRNDDGNGGNGPEFSTVRQGRGRAMEFYTVQQVADALRASGGIKTQAAKKLKDATGLGHYRKSCLIARYIEKYPELQVVMKEIEGKTLDLAESKLIRAMKNEQRKDHLRAVCFYLKHKGKGRGYVTRGELTGAEGKPLIPERHLDLTRLTDKELAELEELYAKAAVERPTTERGTGTDPHAPGTFGGNGRDPAGEVQT